MAYKSAPLGDTWLQYPSVTQGDAIRLSTYEFLLMPYGNHMSIFRRLEVITGQLTFNRLKPTMTTMTPKRH